MAAREGYESVQKHVQSTGGAGHKHKRRTLNDRLFPKATLRNFATKYGAYRMSGVDKKDVYSAMDEEFYGKMHDILQDAITVTKAAGEKVVKERDMVRAIALHGGPSVGLGEAKHQ